MAIRAWVDGDIRLALRLLQWVQPAENNEKALSNSKTNQNWNLMTA